MQCIVFYFKFLRHVGLHILNCFHALLNWLYAVFKHAHLAERPPQQGRRVHSRAIHPLGWLLQVSVLASVYYQVSGRNIQTRRLQKQSQKLYYTVKCQYKELKGLQSTAS